MKRARETAAISVASVIVVVYRGHFLGSREGILLLLVLSLFMLGAGVLAIKRKPRGATLVLGPAVLGIVVSTGLAVLAALLLAGVLTVVRGR